MIVLGLDPGPERSALVAYNGTAIVGVWEEANADIEALLDDPGMLMIKMGESVVLVIEKMESFGMIASLAMLETVFHSGRFAKAWAPHRVERVTRKDIKRHLTGSTRTTDADIRRVLMDRFGGEASIGKKKTPGPLYELKGHLWAAFAVALTWYDQHANDNPIRPGVNADF